ncbi:MAG: AraC family transcriptional regulator [Tannerellaceae bacterium]|jgi:AraC-like DNA-binding protein|nr:AraC family transcriptional regulator [Tannerellaceae bacterium]
METKDNLELILLNVARKVHDADWNWKGVNSPFARIYMVESGTAKVIMPDGEHIIEPGHLYLIPAFVTHSYENNSTFTLYYIHIYDEYNIFDRLNFPFSVLAYDSDTTLIQRLLAINPGRELTRSDPEAYDNLPTLIQSIARNEQLYFCTLVETKGILLQLFSRFLEKAEFKQSSIDNRILKIVRHIRENINRNIGINELSTLCNLNKDHFIRLFKKEMDCTPLQYINLKKIERAQLMLIISHKSIKDISYALGFDNISYFYRLFRRITGLSPRQYKLYRHRV